MMKIYKKIYEKREYYSNVIPQLEYDLTNYNSIKQFRDNICSGELKYYSHQSFQVI